MTMEGKVLGYDKKTVTWAVIAVILALVVFYAGAEYEKNKLVRLGVCKGGAHYSTLTSATKKHHKKKKKATTTTNAQTPGTGTTAPTKNQASGTGTANAASGKTSSPSNTPTTTPAAPGTGTTN